MSVARTLVNTRMIRRGSPRGVTRGYRRLSGTYRAGPCLEQAGLALGVVEAINGARRPGLPFTGEAAARRGAVAPSQGRPSPRRRMDDAGGKPDPAARR
ncbi:hypothetical protein MJ575_15210 [Klebsiella pneumoniae]|nr:hypothetical protein MJ575_15210 [Klebsiella pneumoniae]